MVGDNEAIPRPAARVLLCDGEGRILMFKARFEGRGRHFWITPGGGLNDGETHLEAAARELWEETGLRYADVPLQCVWTRSHTFEFRGRLIDQQERYYLLRVDEVPEITYENWEEDERNDLVEHRWWTVEEIEASGEDFVPRRLAMLLGALLRDGAPPEPFDVGI